LRQKSNRSRVALAEQYGEDIYDEEDTFMAIMDEYTQRPYVVLCIDNVSKEKPVLDTITWDKADDPGPFRFGCDDYWRTNELSWEEQLEAYPPARSYDRETIKKLNFNTRLDNYKEAKTLENSSEERNGKNAFICPALLKSHNQTHNQK